MRESPFKFLDSFGKEDKGTFFGREKEVNELYSMLFKSPLVLVYGLSGTGKTSIIQCGLSEKFDGPDWLPLHIRRGQDFNASLEKSLLDALGRKSENKIEDLIINLYDEYLRPVFLIFDQFEELFTIGSKIERENFGYNIKKLLENRLPCKIIISLREEYLGHLYPLETEIPGLFDHRLRIEPMNHTKVHEVLTRSFTKFNITLDEPNEHLRQTIINNVSDHKSGIQLPYLQVYLDMLYREDFVRTYPGETYDKVDLRPLVFTKEEIDTFGKIDNVLEKFLTEQTNLLQLDLNEKFREAKGDEISKILEVFVTEEGTKKPIPYILENRNIKIERSFFPNMDSEIVETYIRKLENHRILRFDNNNIEVAHDSLADKIYSNLSISYRQVRKTKNFIQKRYQEYISSKRRNTNLLRSNEWNQIKDQFDQIIPILQTTEEKEEILLFIKKSKSKIRNTQNLKIFIGFSFITLLILFGASRLNEKEARLKEKATREMNEKLVSINNQLADTTIRLRESEGKSRIKSEKLSELYDTLSVKNKILEDVSNSLEYLIKGETKFELFKYRPKSAVLVDSISNILNTAQSNNSKIEKENQPKLKNLTLDVPTGEIWSKSNDSFYENALSYLNNSLLLNPTLEPAIIKMAEIEIVRDNYPQARKLIEQFPVKDPEYLILLHQTIFQSFMGDYTDLNSEKINFYYEYVSNPKYENMESDELRYLMGISLLELILTEKANDNIKKKMIELANSKLKKIKKLSNGQIISIVANLYSMDQLSEIEFYLRKIEPNSNNSLTALVLAGHLSENKEVYLSKAVQHHPESFTANFELGYLYYNEGNQTKARGSFKNASRIKNNDYDLLHSFILSFEEDELFDSALIYLNKAPKFLSINPHLMRHKANNYYKIENIEDAKKYFLLITEKHADEYENQDDYYDALSKLGEIHFTERNYQESINFYQILLFEDEINEVALHGLIKCYEETKQWDLAGNSYLTLLQKFPSNLHYINEHLSINVQNIPPPIIERLETELLKSINSCLSDDCEDLAFHYNALAELYFLNEEYFKAKQINEMTKKSFEPSNEDSNWDELWRNILTREKKLSTIK